MAGLHSVRLRRAGCSDQVLCLVDAEHSTEVLNALKTIVRYARTDIAFRINEVRTGLPIARAGELATPNFPAKGR